MNLYLENVLSLEEYRDSKNKLVNQKQLLKEKLSAFEKKSHKIISKVLPLERLTTWRFFELSERLVW